MSFTQPYSYKGLSIPVAGFKLILMNSYYGSEGERAHCELAVYPSVTDKDLGTNVLATEVWDLQAEAKYYEDPLGVAEDVLICPAFDTIFGKDGDGNALDPRRQMYLFIRSLPKYADAVDLLP